MDYKIIVHTEPERKDRIDGYAKGISKFYWCVVDDHDYTCGSGWESTIDKAFEEAKKCFEHFCVSSSDYKDAKKTNMFPSSTI